MVERRWNLQALVQYPALPLYPHVLRPLHEPVQIPLRRQSPTDTELLWPFLEQGVRHFRRLLGHLQQPLSGSNNKHTHTHTPTYNALNDNNKCITPICSSHFSTTTAPMAHLFLLHRCRDSRLESTLLGSLQYGKQKHIIPCGFRGLNTW